jgi:hypothetical protein
MKINIVTIATGKYSHFLENFISSFHQYLLKGKAELKFIVFTDDLRYRNKDEKVYNGTENYYIKGIHTEYLNWTLGTLLRFHLFDKYQKYFEDGEFTYFVDVDMFCVDNIEDDFLPDKQNKLCGVIHPGFYTGIPQAPFEDNEKSRAFVEEKDRNKTYHQGCLFGGNTSDFIEMSIILREKIDQDFLNNIIAKWHDESHLNRYFMDHQPKELSPSYCYPEKWDLPFAKKIIHISKNDKGFK